MTFQQGRCYDDEYDEKTALMQFRDLQRGTMLFNVCPTPPSRQVLQVLMDLKQNYTASTSPLDTLRIAA